MDCWMFISLQNYVNISDDKFVSASEMIFLESPYSENIIFAICSRSSAAGLPNWTVGNLQEWSTMHRSILLSIMNMSGLTTSHDLHGISLGNTLSCGYIHWYSSLVVHCLTVFTMSLFMLSQCTNSLTRSLVLLMPMWFLCNCSSIWFCEIYGTIIHLPLSPVPSC